MKQKDSITRYLQWLLETNHNVTLTEEKLCFSDKFFEFIGQNKLNHNDWFQEQPLLFDENNEPDYLGTVFYMINSLQEMTEVKIDKFGRFPFIKSYQKKFDCTSQNLVQKYLSLYCAKYGTSIANRPSKIFMTHDIDRVNSGLLQDSLAILKNLNPIQLFHLFFNHLKGKGAWRNIDKILKMESLNDVKATYFWITNNKFDSNYSIQNGDYYIHKAYITSHIKSIESSDLFNNGLHKSSFQDLTLDFELEHLPSASRYNRYHYLKFHPRTDYKALSDSSIELDATLGFAEEIGFRNSYGLPFRPFNLESNKRLDFLEVPLNIMDTTFTTYQNLSKKEIERKIFDFLEQHKENCILSILWHNDKITPYKFADYLAMFKSIIKYIHENKIETVTPQELMNQFY